MRLNYIVFVDEIFMIQFRPTLVLPLKAVNLPQTLECGSSTPLSPETSSRYIGQTALFLQYCVPLMLALNSQKRKQMFKLHYTIIIIVQRRKIFLFNPPTPRMQVNGAALSSKDPLGFGVVVGWVAGYEVVFSEGAGFEPRASEEDSLSTRQPHLDI